MTSRRDVLRLAGAVPAAALLAACDRPPAAPAAPAVRLPDRLLVRTRAGLAVVDARDAGVVMPAQPGVVAHDGTVFATGTAAGKGTRLEVRNVGGRSQYHVDLAGDLAVRVVSPW